MRFRDDIAQKLYNMTQDTAWELAVCIKCKQKQVEFKTPEDKREYYISALCPKCFDNISRGTA